MCVCVYFSSSMLIKYVIYRKMYICIVCEYVERVDGRERWMMINMLRQKKIKRKKTKGKERKKERKKGRRKDKETERGSFFFSIQSLCLTLPKFYISTTTATGPLFYHSFVYSSSSFKGYNGRKRKRVVVERMAK